MCAEHRSQAPQKTFGTRLSAETTGVKLKILNFAFNRSRHFSSEERDLAFSE